MKPLPVSLAAQSLSVTDVYTNLQGLQGIKSEKNDDEALKKVAQQFESLFISMLMKNMRDANAVFEKDSMFHSEESQFYRDLLDKQQALTMAHGRGLGIADALYRQMSNTYGRNSVEGKSVENMSLGNTPINVNRLERRVGLSQENVPRQEVEPSENVRVALASSPEDFIEKITPYAKKAAEKLGIDKAILLAQAALETGWGKYVLANKDGDSSNNLFNIKRGDSWNAESVRQPTLEYENGLVRKEESEFRVYENIASSFDDYIQFVSENERYQNAVNSTDHETYIKELHLAGYATDPEYSKKVLSVYERINTLVNEHPDLVFGALSSDSASDKDGAL